MTGQTTKGQDVCLEMDSDEQLNQNNMFTDPHRHSKICYDISGGLICICNDISGGLICNDISGGLIVDL